MIANGKRPAGAARVAIVTPWFGAGLRGGAEQQSGQLADHLAERGYAVDVLTTCCASFADDWGRNTLRAGSERRDGLTIRRFRTDRRDRRAFERVNAILLGLDPTTLRRSVSPVGDADAEAFCRNSINSSALNAYLATEGAAYDSIVFLPYMFGTTLFGLPLVAERAFLQPCLHHESYAYLTRVAAAVHAARGLLFNSDGELDLAVSLFGPGIISKSVVVGEGIDPVERVDRPRRVGDFTPPDERYVLYIGRQDPAKNVATLVAAFKAFRRNAPASKLKLVLAGQRHSTYADSRAGIVDLGPVSETEKASLLEHCRALAQPSMKESFSRVIYEAWLAGRPVVVHTDCPPTSSAVRTSGGGYLANSTASWERALQTIASDSEETLKLLGSKGREYARAVTPWHAVIDRYEGAFAGGGARRKLRESARWDGLPDLRLVGALADGKANVLFAGPIASIEHIDELLLVFLYLLTIEREARLTIAATRGTRPEAYEELQNEARRLDLADRLLIARDLDTAQLQALYLGADVFVTLDRASLGVSELEDAMWFDIPVLAVDTPAHRVVAGGAAILLRDASDLLAVAVLVEMTVKDATLRKRTIAAQRRKRSPAEASRAARP